MGTLIFPTFTQYITCFFLNHPLSPSPSPSLSLPLSPSLQKYSQIFSHHHKTQQNSPTFIHGDELVDRQRQENRGRGGGERLDCISGGLFLQRRRQLHEQLFFDLRRGVERLRRHPKDEFEQVEEEYES